jgi:hypothetical protein
MIQALWIITDAGQCIFSHKYIDMDIEDQLISGLLTAFDAFSAESGIGGVQQIGGKDNQFVYGSSGKLLVAALADKDDDEQLVEKLMNTISERFQEQYHDLLPELGMIDLNLFESFKEDVDDILFPKVYNRGVTSTVFATIITIAYTVGVLFILLDFISATNSAFLIFVACVPGLFIGAVIAGTRKFALIATSIGILPVTLGNAYFILIDYPLESSILYIVLMAEQFLAIAILCAILGGKLVESRRLFPLKGSSNDQERLNSSLQMEATKAPPMDKSFTNIDEEKNS